VPHEAFATCARFGTLIGRDGPPGVLMRDGPTMGHALAWPSSPAELIGFAA
jgi:hypothetical protein